MKIGVHNPLEEDFTIKYNGESVPSAKAGKTTYFEPHIAKHIKKHLVNYLLNKNWPGNKNVEMAKRKFMKQISVKTKK